MLLNRGPHVLRPALLGPCRAADSLTNQPDGDLHASLRYEWLWKSLVLRAWSGFQSTLLT